MSLVWKLGPIRRSLLQVVFGMLVILVGPAHAQRPDATGESDTPHLPPDSTTHQVLALPGGEVRFTATAGSILLRSGNNTPLSYIAFIAYQKEGADAATRPVTFVFNGGPGMASAWLQMGAVGPWRVRFDPATDSSSATPIPVANADTWLDITDLVFVDPPGTGYSRVVTTDAEARRHLWSVDGDVDALGEMVRQWLDHAGRNVSPKFILGESYGGFRGPRLARKLQSDEGVGISGMILLSPLLDTHIMSGYADPLGWVDLLPSEVAVVRGQHGPVSRADLADVETYASGDYLVDIMRGAGDAAAVDRLTERVAGLTGFDPALVRQLGGRLDRYRFQLTLTPGRVSSAYDGTITRPNPAPRALAAQFPDPVLIGWQASVTSAMMMVYAEKLNWRPDTTYHLANDAVFSAWEWGHGMGRPESIGALQASRSLDPHMRVLIGHGMFDMVTPYFGTARMLRMLPEMPGAEPIVLRVYPGGHMFYFDDPSRAALHTDAKTVFDPSRATEGSR